MIDKTVHRRRNPGADSRTVFLKGFSRLDALALGIAIGGVAGAGLFAATLFLVLKGGENVGQNLSLLSQFFVGYSVTVAGAFVGFAWAFVSGFCWGWAIAFLRNSATIAYLYLVRLWASLSQERFLDRLD